MKGKIGLIICLLSAAVLYGTGLLFWVAVANALIHIGFDFSRAYITAIPSMKKFEAGAKEMYNRGASEEEIENLDYPIEPEDYERVPRWVPFMIWSTHLASIALLVTGIVLRFS